MVSSKPSLQIIAARRKPKVIAAVVSGQAGQFRLRLHSHPGAGEGPPEFIRDQAPNLPGLGCELRFVKINGVRCLRAGQGIHQEGKPHKRQIHLSRVIVLVSAPMFGPVAQLKLQLPPAFPVQSGDGYLEIFAEVIPNPCPQGIAAAVAVHPNADAPGIDGHRLIDEQLHISGRSRGAEDIGKLSCASDFGRLGYGFDLAAGIKAIPADAEKTRVIEIFKQ